MRNRLAWLVGGMGLAAAVARALRQGRHRPAPPPAASDVDPRAEVLRRRLEESRELVAEREEFESGETPVDQAEPPSDPAERRRRVHETGRAAADRMRRRAEG